LYKKNVGLSVRAPLIRPKVWSKYILRPKFIWTLVKVQTLAFSFRFCSAKWLSDSQVKKWTSPNAAVIVLFTDENSARLLQWYNTD